MTCSAKGFGVLLLYSVFARCTRLLSCMCCCASDLLQTHLALPSDLVHNRDSNMYCVLANMSGPRNNTHMCAGPVVSATMFVVLCCSKGRPRESSCKCSSVVSGCGVSPACVCCMHRCVCHWQFVLVPDRVPSGKICCLWSWCFCTLIINIAKPWLTV
jgi:hypothetical protein